MPVDSDVCAFAVGCVKMRKTILYLHTVARQQVSAEQASSHAQHAAAMALLDAFYKWAFLFLFFCSFGTFILHHLVVALWYKTQNLKKRYNAEWALVTGSSSG